MPMLPRAFASSSKKQPSPFVCRPRAYEMTVLIKIATFTQNPGSEAPARRRILRQQHGEVP